MPQSPSPAAPTPPPHAPGPARWLPVAIFALLVAASLSCKGEEAAPTAAEAPAPAAPEVVTPPEGDEEDEAVTDADPPEPTLDPEGPREKFELVWEHGRKHLRSIHHERYDIIRRLTELKFDDRATKQQIDALAERLREYTVGRTPAQLETAATRLCELIEEVRGPLAEMITTGEAALKDIDAEIAALEAQEEEGKAVTQRQWDRVQQTRARTSQPVAAARFALLAVKSMLDEAYVLADFGPRRAQLELRECLGALADPPLPFDQAQQQLERVVERTRRYR